MSLPSQKELCQSSEVKTQTNYDYDWLLQWTTDFPASRQVLVSTLPYWSFGME